MQLQVEARGAGLARFPCLDETAEVAGHRTAVEVRDGHVEDRVPMRVAVGPYCRHDLFERDVLVGVRRQCGRAGALE